MNNGARILLISSLILGRPPANLVQAAGSEPQAASDALARMSKLDPTLPPVTHIHRGDVPDDPATGRPFDPREIAWDYPQRTYNRFIVHIENLLGSASGANSLIPGLGDHLHGWAARRSKGLMPGLEGIEIARGGDRTARLQFCNADRDCVHLQVVAGARGVRKISYEGVFDVEYNLYPSEGGDAPGQLTRWHWTAAANEAHFTDWLRRVGVLAPMNPCAPGIIYLNSVRRNGRLIFQSWKCAADNP